MSFGIPVRNGLGIGLRASTSVGTRGGVPPGAPTIGTATIVSSTSATVTFTPPANPGIPAVITSYTVTSSPGGITATGSSSPITVTGLTSGVAYTFTVAATNAAGTGPSSAPSNSVQTQVPGAPTSVSATSSTATTASVAFTAPVNPGVPAPITGYTVTSSPGGITATGSSSPITVTGLTTGTTYTFTVTATNAAGTGPASAASNSVTPVIPAVVRYTSRLASTSEGSTSDFASNSGGLSSSWSYSGTNSDLVTITTSGVSAVLQGWTIGNSTGATNSFDFRLVVISGTTSGGTILKQETFTGLALATGAAQTMVLFSDGGILLAPGTYTVGFAWDNPLSGRTTYYASGGIRTSSSVTGTAGTLGVNYGNVTAFSGSGGLATTNGTSGNGSGQDMTFQWRV